MQALRQAEQLTMLQASAHRPIHKYLPQVMEIMEFRSQVAKKLEVTKDGEAKEQLYQMMDWANESLVRALDIPTQRYSIKS
jgi:hypothetical protein